MFTVELLPITFGASVSLFYELASSVASKFSFVAELLNIKKPDW